MRWSFAVAMWAIWSILVVGAPTAGAEGNPDAARLFQEGRALAEQGKHVEACERFARSHALERAAGTMLNLGDCAERAGELRRAWLLYDEAAREYERTGKAGPAKFARDLADALAPRLATVVVRIAEPRAAGLTVRIAGRAVTPAAEIVERLEPGTVRIEVGATGREPFATATSVALGAAAVVEVPALRAMDGGVVVAPPPVDRPVRTRRQRRRVLIAAGVGGAGVLAAGVAGAFAAAAVGADRTYKDKQEELGCTVSCTEAGLAILEPYYDRAVRRADLATGFAIGGAALIAGGVVLYLTAPREQISVAPAVAPGTVGLLATVRF